MTGVTTPSAHAPWYATGSEHPPLYMDKPASEQSLGLTCPLVAICVKGRLNTALDGRESQGETNILSFQAFTSQSRSKSENNVFAKWTDSEHQASRVNDRHDRIRNLPRYLMMISDDDDDDVSDKTPPSLWQPTSTIATTEQSNEQRMPATTTHVVHVSMEVCEFSSSPDL